MAGKDLDKNSLIQKINVIFHETEGNFVTSSMTADPDLIGIPLFDEPLIGLASATDPLFQKYKEKDVIGPWFMTPEEWMPGAGTVISIFLKNRRAGVHCFICRCTPGCADTADYTRLRAGH